MTTTTANSQPNCFHASEIFRLHIQNTNLIRFKLTPEVDRDEANHLSYYLSKNLPFVVVIWEKPYFYALGTRTFPISLLAEEWKSILEQIHEKGAQDFSDYTCNFEDVQLTEAVPPVIVSQLATQILKTSEPYPFSLKTALNKNNSLNNNNINVRRNIVFWAEPIEIVGIIQPAITLTLKNKFVMRKNLAEFFLNHPNKHKPEKLLIDLAVQDRSREMSINGTIKQLLFKPTKEHREKLIEQAKSEISKQALRDALSEKILVEVQFGKAKKLYKYGMSALRACITSETASRFGLDWGQLLKETKIPYKERQKILIFSKEEANDALSIYGIEIISSINSRDYPGVFWNPSVPIEQTKLLFGNNFTFNANKILDGLSKGGVYRHHQRYSELSRPIRISAFNLCNREIDNFIQQLEQRLKIYKFESISITECLSLKSFSGTEARVEVEKAVNNLMVTPTDIVLTFLPQSDRDTDEQEGGSLYHTVYDLLIRRQIASQMIYEDTLSIPNNYRFILNQVVLGILAKLGNLPFILAEPLQIADYFIGLDISRKSKAKLSGTVNACASIRLYGKQGQFIRYRLEDALIEGEEIPKRVLERLLPAKELEGKTVLIYRDGYFCGQEIDNLLEWAKAVGSKLGLVECEKSGTPRLYRAC